MLTETPQVPIESPEEQFPKANLAEPPTPANNPPMPTAPYVYNPYQYYTPGVPIYPSYEKPRTNPVLQVVFWIFYALVGFWVDLSLAISLWVCALILPFTLPLTALARNVWNEGWWYANGYDGRYDWPWIGQSDAFVYSMAGIASFIGVLLLIFAVMTVKPMIAFHRAMFRDLGGLAI